MSSDYQSDTETHPPDSETCLPIPTDALSWWRNVNTAWRHLYKILDLTLQMDRPTPGSNNNETLSQRILYLKNEEDPELLIWLERAWLLAPDMSDMVIIPGWNVLTDLLSEKRVLYEKLTSAQIDTIHTHEEEYLVPLMSEIAQQKAARADMKKLLKDRRKGFSRYMQKYKKITMGLKSVNDLLDKDNLISEEGPLDISDL